MTTPSAGGIPAAPSARRKASIPPWATPASARLVVGTTTWPMISGLSLSSSTALVKVPPTSMPLRTSRPTGRRLLVGDNRAQHEVDDERVDDDHQSSPPHGRTAELGRRAVG